MAITVRAEAILKAADPDIAKLGEGRWEVARALREYQLYKHGMIFDPALRDHGERAVMAGRMKAECTRVGEAFHKYVLKWSVVSIGDHWSEYQPAALASIARIRAQLEKEKASVAELLRLTPVA